MCTSLKLVPVCHEVGSPPGSPKKVLFAFAESVTGSSALSDYFAYNRDYHLITYKRKLYYPEKWCFIPCGKCFECTCRRANDWKVRCWCESLYHDYNYFLTLTYRDSELPVKGDRFVLSKSDVQKFFKRLRSAGYNVCYYLCGEYGPQTLRPHYHALIFSDSFISADVFQDLWKKGFISLTDFSPASAAYTARYTQKKIMEDLKDLDFLNAGLVPPFSLSSRRPAIGKQYCLDNIDKIVKYNNVILPDGDVCPIPVYFKKLIKSSDEIDLIQYESDSEKNMLLALSRKIGQVESSGSSFKLLEMTEKMKVDKLKRNKN